MALPASGGQRNEIHGSGIGRGDGSLERGLDTVTGTGGTTAMAGAGRQPVTVAAVHGSLECAGRHVLVGHFAGTPIGGAEAFLDERLGRRLSTRQLLGHYPERVGDTIVVDNPNRSGSKGMGYPPGAVVVGLDLPGELTREKLTIAVSAGLLRYAIRWLEAEPGPDRVLELQLLELSAVPMGTAGVGAMSVESCVAALADGVAAANEALHRQVDPRTGARAWERARIAGLEILEVLSDKAERVAHAVRRSRDLAQVDTAGHTEFVLEERLRNGEGGLPASLSGPEQAGDWQRVIIRNLRREQQVESEAAPPARTTSVLEFTAIGRRARADRMQVPIDLRAVETLVEGATRDARPGGQVGHTLYELLLPNELKSDLARSENLQLIVDENTADLPWEALTARFGGTRARQLALRGGLLRQFRETEGARHTARAPAGNRVLVIGNPPPPRGTSPLPGASREALAVAQALGSNDFDVRALVWGADGRQLLDSFPELTGTTGRRALDALFAHDWRILHIAAHGRFEPDDSSSSGVVIDEETSITANVVRQLPTVPELVFLNCCHLGRVGDTSGGMAHANRLAASVARELMRIGVQAVVAAGWAVDDAAAVVFAETFYRQLLGGAFFGAAVQCSRQQAHESFPGSATWAAFQCYGDPGYRLRSSVVVEGGSAAMVSPDELVRRVRTITVLAGKIGLPDFDDISRREEELLEELDRHRGGLARHRWDIPLVLYELGVAYGELGAYDKAVECYRQAWDHPQGNAAPVKLLEQLGNFEVRLAQCRVRDRRAPPGTSGGGDGVDVDVDIHVKELVDAAERHLGLALGLGETPERLALLGSFHKKAATLSGGDERRHHLVEAARRYAEARDLRSTLVGEATPYHTLNWLQLATLAGMRVPEAEVAAALGSVTPAVSGPSGPRRPGRGDPEGFWERVVAADLALTRFLLGEPTDPAQLENEYRWAFATRSSRRDRDSVVDHLRDVAAVRGGATLAELARRLDDRR
ncbi:MAG: CHAT domain-containing protein [Actinomycetota bacterium]|nr:CHAT domain-containing protein [Actinomycetota bacterium]